jgi:sulfur-carrier protein adenylyltransferase/sulfurtransferase
MGGLFSAQVQMDYLPGICSAAFFAIRAQPSVPDEGTRPARLLQAGMAVQRFWLMATRLGLAMQPGFATLIFAEYGDRPPSGFTDTRMQRLSAQVSPLLGKDRAGLVFLGRLGEPRQRSTRGRSVRRALSDLTLTISANLPHRLPSHATDG